MQNRKLYKRLVSTFLMASLIGCQSKLISEQVLEGDSIKIKVNTRGTLGNNSSGFSNNSRLMLLLLSLQKLLENIKFQQKLGLILYVLKILALI